MITASKIIAADCGMPALPIVGNCYDCWVLPGRRVDYDRQLVLVAKSMWREYCLNEGIRVPWNKTLEYEKQKYLRMAWHGLHSRVWT